MNTGHMAMVTMVMENFEVPLLSPCTEKARQKHKHVTLHGSLGCPPGN